MDPPVKTHEIEETNMADFVEKSVTKTAVRALASPIADVSSFDTIVQSVITGNPFGCVAYTESGVPHQPVEKSKARAKPVKAASRCSSDSCGARWPLTRCEAPLPTPQRRAPAHAASISPGSQASPR